MNCVFCAIIARDLPSTITYEDDHVLGFLTTEPVATGHTLLVPKNHADNLWDIPETDIAALAAAAKHEAERLQSQLHATGLNLLHATGADAQQSVNHFHLHLVPRYANDGLDLWLRAGL